MINEIDITNSDVDIEVAEELSDDYADVLKALRKCERIGLFPFKSQGNITLHYDSRGKLVKIVPAHWVGL